ncbi:MAG: hypothetical protein ACR2RE_08030 [Geminicoccaceae bacterium]
MTPEERVYAAWPKGAPFLPSQNERDIYVAMAEAIRAAVEEEREVWFKWLNKTHTILSEEGTPANPPPTILGKDTTLIQAAQIGYSAALRDWEATIRARKEEKE